MLKASWGPLQWRMRWPWKNDREQRKKLQEEYERRRKQLHNLCCAVKADSISDLQEILCCMVLSECVYKVLIFSALFLIPGKNIFKYLSRPRSSKHMFRLNHMFDLFFIDKIYFWIFDALCFKISIAFAKVWNISYYVSFDFLHYNLLIL